MQNTYDIMTGHLERELMIKICSRQAVERRNIAESVAKLDCSLFERLCVTQGVVPTIYKELQVSECETSPVLSRLRSRYYSERLRSIKTCGTAIEISKELEKAGVPNISYKGVAFAQMAYGDVCARPAGDLDFIVPKNLAARAAQILRKLNYLPSMPGTLSLSQEAALRAFLEGRQFYNHDTGLSVDLHWELFDRWIDLRIPFSDLWGRRIFAQTPQGELPTVSQSDAALIACLHGCQHAFEVLKQVLDVSTVAQLEHIDWEEVVFRAGHRKPMVSLSLQLANQVLGTVNPTTAPLSRNTFHWAHAIGQKLKTGEGPGGTKLLASRVAINLEPELTTRTGAALHRARLSAFLTPTLEDVRSVDLPSGLRAGYRILRAIGLAKKLILRLKSKMKDLSTNAR